MNNPKKKIAIVINTSWNVYNFRLNLLKSLQQTGYHIVVIAPKDRYSKLLEKENFEYHNLYLDNDNTNTLKELKLLAHLFWLYRKVKPDVILQYTIKPNIYGNLAAAFLRIPTISNISGLGTVFLNNKFSSKIARWLYCITLRYSNKVFFQNSDDLELFVKKRLIKREKTTLIPGSGIDTNKFKPIDYEIQNTTFLMISRLIKDKGIVEYIEAIRIVKKRFSDIKFWLIGGLYEKNPTSISAGTLNSWIDEGLIEYVDHTDHIRDYISKASCIVLPSYREGLSRSLLEAMSMAKPIITSNVPGCKDLVTEGKNGYLCNVKDSQDLAKSMIKFINLPQKERDNFGKVGRKKVLENFSDKIIFDIYLKAIKQL